MPGFEEVKHGVELQAAALAAAWVSKAIREIRRMWAAVSPSAAGWPEISERKFSR